MPTVATPSPQLDLFIRDTPAYQKALARYDVLRPIFQDLYTPAQQSRATGIPYHRLWQDLRRFQHAGIVGLLDRRTLPHARGKSPSEVRMPTDIQQHVIRLALAHPFTAHELARIVQTCYALTIGHRGIQRVLRVHRLTPDTLRLHHQLTQQTPLPPAPSGQQLDLALEPTTQAHRLIQALDPTMCTSAFGPITSTPPQNKPAGASLNSWRSAFARAGWPNSWPSSRRSFITGRNASRPSA
jgi:hypothetical protein